jgi:hypothetical protein
VTLFAVMVCVVVAEIGTSIGFNSLIVMLAAGVYLENFSRARVNELLANLEFAQLPVFLVFFALAGGEIALGRLAAALIPVVLLVCTRAATFFVGAKVACERTGARPEVARFAWFGLLPQSGLALALALLIQRKFPSFGEKASVIVFGVVGINELVSPVILRAMIMRSGEAGRREAVKLGH